MPNAVRAFALALALPALPALAEPVTFRFAPPDGLVLVQELKATREMDLGIHGKRTDTQESVTRLRFERTTDGYRVTARAIRASMERDGVKIENPFLQAVLETEVAYLIDAEGHLREVKGYEGLLDKLTRGQEPAVAAAVKSMINEDALRKKEAAEWEGRIGQFPGRTVEVGDSWSTADRFELPTGGELEFQTVTRVKGWEPCGEKRCLRLEYRYESDPTALGALAQQTADSMIEHARRIAESQPGTEDKPARDEKAGDRAAGTTVGTEPRAAREPEGAPRRGSGLDSAVAAMREEPASGATVAGPPQLTGRGERLVEPDTLLFHSERMERDMEMPFALPGIGEVRATLHEVREYTFRPERAADE